MIGHFLFGVFCLLMLPLYVLATIVAWIADLGRFVIDVVKEARGGKTRVLREMQETHYPWGRWARELRELLR